MSLLLPQTPAIPVTGFRIRWTPGVRSRAVGQQAIVYVPARDRFFALDARHTNVLRKVRDHWRPLPADTEAVRTLAEMGVVETNPFTPRRAFAGRSAAGRLEKLPISRLPLVVNCLVTAFCPLRCRYCHADDLMVGYREGEDDRGLTRVIRAAAATPAMVGVVTGGEPLARIERTERLVARLAETGKASLRAYARLVPEPAVERFGVVGRVTSEPQGDSHPRTSM